MHATQAADEAWPDDGFAVPAMQLVHTSAVPGEYVPGLQVMQTEAPGLGFTVPGGQLVQWSEPVVEYVLEAHVRQAEMSTAPLFGLYVPPMHAVHVASPSYE